MAKRHQTLRRLAIAGLLTLIVLAVLAAVALKILHISPLTLKVFMPGWFGMEQLAPGLYLESTAAPAQRVALLQNKQKAHALLEAAYGQDLVEPVIIACPTQTCYERFGRRESRGVQLAGRLLLGPRGLTAPIMAHEWSHAQLAHLVGHRRLRKIPRWFDEGLAAVISKEPTHGEPVWAKIIAEHLPHPELQQLVTFKDWHTAVNKYGDGDRRHPGRLKVVYATAAHEVRRWLARVGPSGLHRFIQAFAAGKDFETAYRQ